MKSQKCTIEMIVGAQEFGNEYRAIFNIEGLMVMTYRPINRFSHKSGIQEGIAH